MSTAVQLRRGTATQHNTFTGLNGEVTVDTTKKTLRVHDGATVGGFLVDFQVNVRRFGAKGDNVTDDVAAIQAAINDVQTAGGGVVFFPAGTYVVADELLITSNRVILRGEQHGQSISSGTSIRTSAANKDIVRVSAALQAIAGFAMENIQLIGNAAGVSGNGLKMVSTAANAIYATTLRNVSVLFCAGHGIYFDSTLGFNFNGQMDGVIVTQCNLDGIRFKGACGQWQVNATYVQTNLNHQVTVLGPGIDNLQFTRLTAANALAGYAGVYVDQASNVTFLDTHTEDNVEYEFLLKTVRGIRIVGGSIPQAGVSKGIVIGFSALTTNRNIYIDVPGWTNTTANKRIDVSLFAGSNFEYLYLGSHADGPFEPADVTGYSTIAAAQKNPISFFAVQAGQIVGTKDNDDAAAGRVGEYQEVYVTFANRVTLANATAKTVVTLPLTAGDWEVDGMIIWVPTGVTWTDTIAGIHTVTDTAPGQQYYSENRPVNTSGMTQLTPPRRVSIAAGGGNAYLIGFVNFSAGGVEAFGVARARRVR